MGIPENSRDKLIYVPIEVAALEEEIEVLLEIVKRLRLRRAEALKQQKAL